jgi:hypothetical protein
VLSESPSSILLVWDQLGGSDAQEVVLQLVWNDKHSHWLEPSAGGSSDSCHVQKRRGEWATLSEALAVKMLTARTPDLMSTA